MPRRSRVRSSWVAEWHSPIVDLQPKLQVRESVDEIGEMHTSMVRSPGLSEKRNRSYWFDQISTSGRTSYDSTAVTSGLVG